MEAAEVSMQHDDDEAHQLEQQLHHGHHMDHGDEGEGGEMKLSEEQNQQPGPMTLEAGMRRSGVLHLDSFYTPTPHPSKESHIPASRQLEIMREFYMRNPTPSRAELDMLAEKTGRPWRKVREYFRQRRNKGRGIQDLDGVPEPARATGWWVKASAVCCIQAAETRLTLTGCKCLIDPLIHPPRSRNWASTRPIGPALIRTIPTPHS
jgi:hypothetical protein